MVPTTSGDKVSGYVIKYTPSYNDNGEVIATDKYITALFGKYTNNCFLVYSDHSTFDGQGVWKPNIYGEIYCDSGGGGGSGGGDGGGASGGDGGGSGGGGGAFTPSQQNPNPNPAPPNQNGATLNPQDIVLLPAYPLPIDEPTVEPCVKMNLLKNDVMFKQQLTNLKNYAQNNFNTNGTNEKSFIRYPKENPTPSDNFEYVPFAGAPGAGVYSSFYPSTVKGSDHFHNINGLPIFSLDDLQQGGIMTSQPTTNVEDLVFTVVTQRGTVYAYQITDKTQFLTFYNKYLKEGYKINSFMRILESNYTIGLNYNNEENEDGFMKNG